MKWCTTWPYIWRIRLYTLVIVVIHIENKNTEHRKHLWIYKDDLKNPYIWMNQHKIEKDISSENEIHHCFTSLLYSCGPAKASRSVPGSYRSLSDISTHPRSEHLVAKWQHEWDHLWLLDGKNIPWGYIQKHWSTALSPEATSVLLGF